MQEEINKEAMAIFEVEIIKYAQLIHSLANIKKLKKGVVLSNI